MITALVSAEVDCHIKSIIDAWNALKKLKDNDPMALSLEIKAIKHEITVSRLKVDIALTTFIKALCETVF